MSAILTTSTCCSAIFGHESLQRVTVDELICWRGNCKAQTHKPAQQWHNGNSTRAILFINFVEPDGRRPWTRHFECSQRSNFLFSRKFVLCDDCVDTFFVFFSIGVELHEMQQRTVSSPFPFGVFPVCAKCIHFELSKN